MELSILKWDVNKLIRQTETYSYSSFSYVQFVTLLELGSIEGITLHSKSFSLSLSLNVDLEIGQFHLDSILQSSVCHHSFERTLTFRLIHRAGQAARGLYFIVFSLNSYNLRPSTHPILVHS